MKISRFKEIIDYHYPRPVKGLFLFTWCSESIGKRMLHEFYNRLDKTDSERHLTTDELFELAGVITFKGKNRWYWFEGLYSRLHDAFGEAGTKKVALFHFLDSVGLMTMENFLAILPANEERVVFVHQGLYDRLPVHQSDFNELASGQMMSKKYGSKSFG